MSKLFFLLLCCATPQVAASSTWSTVSDTLPRYHQLSPAVVTGTRTPKTLANTPIHTRLITAEQIRQSGATHLPELLQQELPSVEFTHALSGELHMNMAGFSGLGVLFLVDGERLAGETMDNVDFSRLSLNDIERIEIVKGAASALYGSSAAGGVINIITRQKKQEPWSLTLDARHARHHKASLGGLWNMGHQSWTQSLNVQHTRSDAYLLHNPNDVALYTKYALTRVLGGRTWNFKERLTWQANEALRLVGRAGYFFRERDYDPGQHNRYRDFSGGLRGEWNIDSSQRFEMSYTFDQYDKSDYYLSSSLDVRDYSNVQHALRSLYTYHWNEKASLVLGGEWQRDYLHSYQFAHGKAHTQWNGSAFGQIDWQVTPRWEIVGALRADHYSHEGGMHPTSKLSLRYHKGALTLRGGYGSGFRSASLKERFMHFLINDIFIIRGHEDLKAERSHNFHLSAEWTRRQSHFTAALGYHKVKHRITTSSPSSERDPGSNVPYVDYINLPHLRILTAEATAQQTWHLGQGRLHAQLNYAYTHEQVAATQTLTPYLPARPHSATAKLDFDRQFSARYGLNLLLNARWFSALQGQEHNATTGAVHRLRYPGYLLLRLGTTHRIGRALRLSVAADNLLNYRPHIYYYNSPPTTGIDLSLGLTLDLHAL